MERFACKLPAGLTALYYKPAKLPYFSKVFVCSTAVLCCVLAFSVLALAAEFSADLIQERGGQLIKSRFYVKGNKTRVESAEGSMIMDMDSGKAYMLQPDEKMYIELPGVAAMTRMGHDMSQSDEELANFADKKYVGAETVNGYRCDKYEIIYHDKSLGKMTQWYSKKLGFPIKMVYHSPYGDMVTEYKNIEKGRVSDSLFEVPAGYRKMTMPDMQ